MCVISKMAHNVTELGGTASSLHALVSSSPLTYFTLKSRHQKEALTLCGRSQKMKIQWQKKELTLISNLELGLKI